LSEHVNPLLVDKVNWESYLEKDASTNKKRNPKVVDAIIDKEIDVSLEQYDPKIDINNFNN